MKTYRGRRRGCDALVTFDGIPLEPRLDLYNHSPDGFEWGYGGSGPAQLALAILANHLGDDGQALALYQSFKWEVVTKLPHRGWTMTSQEIEQALETIRAAIGGAP